MKNLTLLFAAFSMLFITQTKAQSFDIGMLDNAMSLLNKGNQKESSKILGTAVNLLTKETKSSKSNFAGKIIGQLDNVSAVLPMLANGNANVGKIQKMLSTIKMLYGANQIAGMLNGGGGLKGKSNAILSNVGLLKSGLGLLDSGPSLNKITKSLDKVTKKSPKLDKKGIGAFFARKAVNKKLGSSLKLLEKMV